MNPLRALLPLRALPIAERQLLLFAAIVAVALLSLYVQLLQASLVRGNELREVQRAAGPKTSTKAAEPGAQTGFRAHNHTDKHGARVP